MEKQEGKLQVFVKSLDHQKLEYNLDSQTTILQFKELISKDTSLEASKIRLIYKAKNLADESKISEIVNKSGEVFHLIARLQTQPEAPPINQNQQQQQQQRPQNNQGQNRQQIPLNLNNILNQFFPNQQGMGQGQGGQGQGGQNQGQGQRPQGLDLNSLINNLQNTINQQLQDIGQDTGPNDVIVDIIEDVDIDDDQTQHQTQMTDQSPIFGFDNPNRGQNQQFFSQTNNTQYSDIPLPNNNPNGPRVQTQYQFFQPNQNQFNPDIPLFTNPQNTNMNSQFQPTQNQQPQQQRNAQSQPAQPLQQPRIVQQRNVTFSSNNPRKNNVMSINNNEIILSVKTQNENQDANVKLNLQVLKNQTQTMNQSNQINVHPIKQGNDNSATILGVYLNNLYKSLYQFLPHLYEVSYALQNEPKITNINDRQQFTQKIHHLSSLLQNYQSVFQNLEVLKDFNMGNQPLGFYLDNQQTLNENQQIQNERRTVQNLQREMMSNMMMNNNVTLGEISGRMGEVPEDDFLSILLQDMNLNDLMKFFNGESQILNTYQEKIKYRFQNALIKYQNNSKKYQEYFYKDFIEFFEDDLMKKNTEKIYEGFDVKLVSHQIYDQYFNEFKEIFSGNYQNQQEQFDVVFKKLLFKFLGKLLYEISEGVDGGIAYLKSLYVKRQTEYGERLGFSTMMQGDQIKNLIENFWKEIEVEYKNIKDQEQQKNQEQKYLNELEKQKQEMEMEEINQEEFSEAYLQGKVFNKQL